MTWQQLESPAGPVELGPFENAPGHPSHYAAAVIPSAADSGWGPADDPARIDFVAGSAIGVCGGTLYADYTYFQTFLSLPAGYTPTSFTLTVGDGMSGGVDDGVRLSIFNDDAPSGDGAVNDPASYIRLFDPAPQSTGNLASFLRPGLNRIVLTLVDDCPAQRSLLNAVLNLEPAVPPPATATAPCDPSTTACSAAPPPGPDNAYQVSANGGDGPTTLVATLNGGSPPTCGSRALTDGTATNGEFSQDWIKFGFTDVSGGSTWDKQVTLTRQSPTNRPAARREIRETLLCFRAPYEFVTLAGKPLLRGTGDDGRPDFQGFLPDCKYLTRAMSARIAPEAARPCISLRQTVPRGAGWVAQITFRVPANAEDPQGRSARSKKAKKR